MLKDKKKKNKKKRIKNKKHKKIGKIRSKLTLKNVWRVQNQLLSMSYKYSFNYMKHLHHYNRPFSQTFSV